MPNTPVTRQELLDAIRTMKDTVPDYNGATPNGPVKTPADKYIHVPETTREWIEGLRPDDTKEIDDVRRWFRNTRIITTFGKWVVVALVATLVATGQVGKVIFEALSYFKGAS